MPEDELTPAEDLSEQTEAPPAGPSLIAKIKMPLFVAAVVGAEVLVAYIFIPDPSKTAAMAGATMVAGPQDKAPTTEEPVPEEEPELVDQVEVDLGEFDVTAFQPVTNSTVRVTFHLWGTIAQKDEEAFAEVTQDNQQRLREQILVTIRSSDISDLAEPGLGGIKRKIFQKINKTLGKPLLRTVIFSDFSSVEQ